jgi:hypothetical protein
VENLRARQYETALVEHGWLTPHMSGFWYYFTQAGKDMFV